MLQKLKTRLATLSGDKKSVLSLVGGTTIAQGLSFLFSPIQTRLFSPEVFGELSVFTSITGIVGVIVCLRYELAIVLPKDDDEGFALLKLSWFFAALVSLASLVVFGLWGRQIYARFNAPGLARYWYYVPITLLLTGIIQAANYWLTRQRKFTVLSYNKVLPVLAINLVSIGLGLAGDRALGARLFSSLVSQLVNLAVLATVLVPDSKVVGRAQYGKKELIGKYKNFLVYDIWGALINNISFMIVPILMSSSYGSYYAGQYSLSMRVIQIPISLIGSALGLVFYNSANKYKINGELSNYVIRLSKSLFLFTLPIAAFLMLFGRTFFIFIFGLNWDHAGVYTQILSFWAMIWFISSPVSMVYPILQKQNISLISSTSNFLGRVLAIYLGKLLNNDIVGITLFSISGFITNGISLLLCIKYAKINDKEITNLKMLKGNN